MISPPNEVPTDWSKAFKEIGIVESFIRKIQNFPGGPVVKTLPSSVGDEGSIPGWETKIPHALWLKNQNIKQVVSY